MADGVPSLMLWLSAMKVGRWAKAGVGVPDTSTGTLGGVTHSAHHKPQHKRRDSQEVGRPNTLADRTQEPAGHEPSCSAHPERTNVRSKQPAHA